MVIGYQNYDIPLKNESQYPSLQVLGTDFH